MDLSFILIGLILMFLGIFLKDIKKLFQKKIGKQTIQYTALSLDDKNKVVIHLKTTSQIISNYI